MRRLLGLVVVPLLPAAAQAQVWAETPDAPAIPVPGQITFGVGPLTTITGALAPTSDDVDMFCIRVIDPLSFSAVVTGGTVDDTQLFMFDLAGFGVNHNDDNGGGPGATWSGIGAGASPVGVPAPIPLIAGAEYGLAISSYDVDPANGTGAEI